MAPINELDRFRTVWNMEAESTARLLDALPPSQYDFRPDPKGRSLGELAWHLSEVDAYISYGISKGAVTFQEVPPNLQLPREVRLLAPGYRASADALFRTIMNGYERYQQALRPAS